MRILSRKNSGILSLVAILFICFSLYISLFARPSIKDIVLAQEATVIIIQPDNSTPDISLTSTITNTTPPIFTPTAISIKATITSTIDNHVNVYWIERITEDGRAIYHEYDLSESYFIDVSDLEIWSEKIQDDNPMGFVYWDSEPDIKELLLQYGFATLKDVDIAQDKYVQAQLLAEQEGVGLWYVSPTPIPTLPIISRTPPAQPSPSSTKRVLATPSPLATPEATPIPIPTQPPSLIDQAKQTVLSIDWSKGFNLFITAFLGAVGLYGGAEFIQLISGWHKRHQVPFIMIGKRSTGKTWLWSRLVDPDVELRELQKIPTTDATNPKKVGKMPMGRFEVYPEIIDTPGGRLDQLLNQILTPRKKFQWIRNFVIKRKKVWVIMLSTTPKSKIDFSSEENDKVDETHITEQFGFIEVILGILALEPYIKPDMVIACISKFDMFSEYPPDDSQAESARDLLLNDVFKNHLQIIKTQCDEQNVPYQYVLCSAAEGWGVHNITRYIKKALFQK